MGAALGKYAVHIPRILPYSAHVFFLSCCQGTIVSHKSSDKFAEDALMYNETLCTISAIDYYYIVVSANNSLDYKKHYHIYIE